MAIDGQLKALTKEASESGAVPALSTLNTEDDRWETYQVEYASPQMARSESLELSLGILLFVFCSSGD